MSDPLVSNGIAKVGTFFELPNFSRTFFSSFFSPVTAFIILNDDGCEGYGPKKNLHKIIDLNQQDRRQTQRRISANLTAFWSWMPAVVWAHSVRCCAIRSLGNSRRPACAAWICDDRAGGNSHNALTDRQLRIFASAKSYEKTYNLAGSKSKSYHRIILIFCRLRSNIITLAPARSSKNSTSLYLAARDGTRDANCGAPERTSPTS